MFSLIIGKGLKYGNGSGSGGSFLANPRRSLGYLVGCTKSISLDSRFRTIVMVNLMIEA